MHQNVVPKILHTKNIRHHAWKSVRTILQCITFLLSQEEVMKSRQNNGTTLRSMNPPPNITSFPVCKEDGGGNGGKSGFG